ncbi:UPF0617 protein [Symbiodinium microadriaticum]|uniref:UPF0617 protein n=1 Tax=Symbiodinium microadriaticum TaxID=2951 RepID=A0A1Q9C2B0_SYMMI|nr:UPF0617 protein [Symbiodinium microadriaticum]CAE7878096.1 bmt5 [Symbiodinium microadriaticum]CAE7945375.1 bmt5 [Symbiodinium sp. KB8]
MSQACKVQCRFGSACARLDCWFEHPLGHSPEGIDSIPCRFGARCHRPDCRFSHPAEHDPSEVLPPDCRLGAACCRVGCPFKHPAAPTVARDAASEKRICVWFQKGHCRNGSQCMFQHVQQERDANVLVVRNLPKSEDPLLLESEILAYFKSFGYVSRIQAKTDLDNRCRGFAFVIFADACCAADALACNHPHWDIRRKTELPMYIEGTVKMSRKAALPERVQGEARLPFVAADRVLLVGEGDFSFAATALTLGFLGTAHCCASSKEPPRDAKHLVQLAKDGLRCLTDIDATRLAEASLTGAFDVVVFNFPHTGEPNVEANQALLKGFLGSATTSLRGDGRIAVTLKQTWPYTEWELEACGASVGLRVVDAYPFPAQVLIERGYTHTTTDNIPHKVEHLHSARTVEFVRA